MAQDTWCNVSLSGGPVATAKHGVIGGAQNSGDCTFSFDKAKLLTLPQVDSVLAVVRAWIIGSGINK